MNTNSWISKSNPKGINSNSQDKITLFRCPSGCLECKQNVSEINQYYTESDSYLYNKEYQMSIHILKSAFKTATKSHGKNCRGCLELLRFIIIESLENICADLKKMSSGLIIRKRYKESFLMAKNTLKEFRSFIAETT